MLNRVTSFEDAIIARPVVESIRFLSVMPDAPVVVMLDART